MRTCQPESGGSRSGTPALLADTCLAPQAMDEALRLPRVDAPRSASLTGLPAAMAVSVEHARHRVICATPDL